MQGLIQIERDLAELHWLAFLLTESRGTSIDIAVESVGEYADEKETRPRRFVIRRALAAIREKLAASARRTESHGPSERAMPSREWSLNGRAGKSEMEKALLAIDVFPRAALLLSVFEGVPLEEAASLLDASAKLVGKALAIGLRELTSNLAKIQGWKSAVGPSSVFQSNTQFA
jgi:DNA-directed RNA polymerase specialized sigma24 family protein